MKRWIIGARAPLGVVRWVEGASPAAGAGVQPGDVMAEVDRRRVVDRRQPGSSTLLLVHRNEGDLCIALGS